MKKLIIFAFAFLFMIAAPLSVSAAGPAILFRFDKNWEYYFTGEPWFLDAEDSDFDEAENALKFITTPYEDGNFQHAMLQANLDSDYIMTKSEYQWAVICMKRPFLSPSLGKIQSRKVGIIAIMPGNVTALAEATAETGDEYKTYVMPFGTKSYWEPAPEDWSDEEIAQWRIHLFGLPPIGMDNEGGSVAYLRYIAIFDNEADAVAFAEAHPDGSDIAGVEPPTRPPTEPTEEPTAGGDSDNTTAAPGDGGTSGDTEEDGVLHIGLIIGIAAGAVALIAVIVFIAMKSGKGKKDGGN